ncbi:MAG: DUF255 domain-containing protein [Desulfobacteraceae bacterium]|nr:DUF255 domain-containing protein [Desulfobacteraceae bacterium]
MPKNIVYILLSAVIGWGVLLPGPAAIAGSTDIHWYSYDSGIKQIKKSDKKGYLHFYTDWCSYCKMMKQKTFSDQEVVAYLNANFVSIRVNAEKEPKVARKYGANQFPFNWFVDQQAERIANQPGFIPPETMVQILQYIDSDDYKKMRFDQYMEQRE